MHLVKRDCKYYKGDIPCSFHKKEGVLCETCPYYKKRGERILIIKLGAIGDVIRTTPLLRRLQTEYPDSEIYWLTDFPDVVPSTVNYIYEYTAKSVEILKNIKFDYLFNLDKDREACALANSINAEVKKGFILDNGFCFPVDEPARDKWLTGLFDDLNKANKKSYPEEIFRICGFEYKKEEYIVELKEDIDINIQKKSGIIGLNTGCGDRWKTRLWKEENWIMLAKELVDSGYSVLLLGGAQEHEKNNRIAEKSGAFYPGHFSLRQFFSLVDKCDVIVTAVSMAFHVAVGLKKKIVLFNNIFNPNEFELFGRGIIIQPDVPCRGCFKANCNIECMDLIKPEEVYNSIKKLL